jgi:hypothetical protein
MEKDLTVKEYFKNINSVIAVQRISYSVLPLRTNKYCLWRSVEKLEMRIAWSMRKVAKMSGHPLAFLA